MGKQRALVTMCTSDGGSKTQREEGDLLHPEITTISLSVFQITDTEIHISMIYVTIKQIVQDISLCNNRHLNGYLLEKFTP